MGIYKRYCLKVQSIQSSLLYFFSFSMDIYKSVKISIGTVMGNPEMQKFVSDHLKTKKMCKHAVKTITLSIKICF